jgi:hypothetical protein
MPRNLMNIRLDEVSAVDAPANKSAKIVLYKRDGDSMNEDDMSDAMKAKMKEYMDKGYSKEDAMKMCMGEKTQKGGPNMDPQELAEKLEALEGQVADLTKRAEAAEAAKAELEKAADEAGFDIEEGKLAKRADPEFIEVGGEKVEKSAVPAAVLKALEAQAEEVAKMKAKEAEVELAKRGAETLPHLAGTDLAKGKLLEAIGGDEEVLKSLKAADAAIAKAMEEIGNNPMDDESSANYRLNKMADEYAEAHKVPFESAYAEVTKSGEGRELMLAARAEG